MAKRDFKLLGSPSPDIRKTWPKKKQPATLRIRMYLHKKLEIGQPILVERFTIFFQIYK